MTTELSTPRLRELEAEVLRRHKDRKLRLPDANPSFTAVSEGRVEGYKMALEDLAPVLAAARKMDKAVDTHLEAFSNRVFNYNLTAKALEVFAQEFRDALAEFKGE